MRTRQCVYMQECECRERRRDYCHYHCFGFLHSTPGLTFFFFLAWLIRILKCHSRCSAMFPEPELLCAVRPPVYPALLPGHVEDTLLSVSVQEEDLNCIRERWSEALIKRREYLDEQIKKIINKPGEAAAGGSL